ncbi:helix-turn-helix transcriptional regulator [Cohnella phaseoli]|uniref:AraC-like DNA-binding protein n=1 Tax=Cohnella phaseoli TaxID=456490 RepID=A0A3D9JQA5_9BACL|nr:AraC family transcriptional regulator [Cohnella phaseoli]RED76303.1 AraC-like DNA-binding protein [Cohnella phaseoli]
MTRSDQEVRQLNYREINPSIHWARRQSVQKTPGMTRRLYDFEMMYVYDGEMIVHYPETGEKLRFLPGDLLFLHAAEPHCIEISSTEGARLIGIHFDFYNEFEISHELFMVVDEERVHADRFCLMPVGIDGERIYAARYEAVPDEIVGWMERISEEFTSEKPGFEMVCKGAMIVLLAALARLQPKPARSVPQAYQDALRSLTGEMSARMAFPWTVSLMAARLSVSEDHFIRLFKEQYGTTPSQYVRRLRHQEAKRCLRETDLKIERVGLLVGYEDLHHFSHAFKKWQGVSPREYRKMSSLL